MEREDGSLIIGPRHGKTLDTYHVSQGSTNDCGPHVVAIIVNCWKGETILDASQIAKAMNRPRIGLRFPPLVIRRIPNWATFPWGIADVLREHGLQARWQFLASEEDLRRALREDHFVAPIFGEPLRRRGPRFTGWSHVALLAGWHPIEDEYVFVDSAKSFPLNIRPRSEFLRYWRNMGRLMVEAY